MRRERTFDPAPVLALFPGQTAAEIGERLGVTKWTVYKWRRGVRGLRRSHADRVACLLGVHPLNLWGEEW